MTDIAMYHGDSRRTGLNTTFSFAPTGGTWRRYVTLPTNAPVRAAPLFLSEYTFTIGSHAGEMHDVVIIATSDNMVAAYAEEQLLAGVVNPLWVTSLGAASTRSGSNIPPPIGVCGTPLIDRGSETLFAVALIHESSGDVFKAFALDLNTGIIQDQEPLHDPGAAGRPTFDPTTVDQRSGLNLVNGWLFATFAAFLAFDEGPYHGWIVAFKQTDLSQQLFLSVTKSVLGGGIWGPGGVAAATDSTLYASTGNATNASASYWTPGKHPGDSSDYFEGVVRVQLTGGPGLKVINWYQPTWARALNDADLDFGGSSPIALPPIGGRQFIITTAKDGNAYLLDGTLPGWGGELWSSVTNPGNPADHALFGAESKCAPAYYHDPVGGNDYVYVVGSSNPGLVAFKVDLSGPSPKLMRAWNAGLSFGDAPGSPFVIADPTTQKALVWVVDPEDSPNAVLRAFDAVSGELVFRSDAVPNNGPGKLPHFAPITGAGKSIFVGTNTGVVGYVNLPPTLSVILDQSTYGQDEVEVQLPGVARFAAGWVKLDGFRPSDLGLNHGNLGSPPASSIPTFSLTHDPSLPSAVASAIGGMLAPPTFAPPVVPGDPGLPDAPQSFLFPFTVAFNNDAGFIAMRNASPSISATTVTLTTSLFGLSDSAPIELTTGEDPRFVDVNPQNPTAFPTWLSFDLRFFKVAVPPGSTKSVFGATMTSNPNDAPDFIANVIHNLNSAGFDGLPQSEGATRLEFLPTDNNGNRVFNFAVARVRLLAKSQIIARTVRVFFRLFQAQNTQSNFEPNTTYRRFSDGITHGHKIPMLGVQNDRNGNPEYVTIPCFATPRVNLHTPVSMTQQFDPPNARDLDTTPGAEADYFFGCWLDINQPEQRFLPLHPPTGNFDGPWNGLPLFSLQEAIIAAPHQCLIAEISFDDTPIPSGATSSSSDKLAQRNIAWIDGPNPGHSASRRMPHPIQVRPTPKGVTHPDELMILWGNTPNGSEAQIYLPSLSATEILDLANRHYTDHFLRVHDAHTIVCPTGGVTFVPLPEDTALAAGLLTIDLPGGIRKGDAHTITVRQLTDAVVQLPPPPPPQITQRTHRRVAVTKTAVVSPTITSRRVMGAFQFNLMISTKEPLLLPEERLLAVLRWMELKMPTTKRWHPVLVRYIDQVAGRVQGFGGNPSQIDPSPTGEVPGLPSKPSEEGVEVCGKIEGIIYDHFGDYAGFVVEDDSGRLHRFTSREAPMRAVVHHAWEARTRVSVIAELGRRHVPCEVILKARGGPKDID